MLVDYKPIFVKTDFGALQVVFYKPIVSINRSVIELMLETARLHPKMSHKEVADSIFLIKESNQPQVLSITLLYKHLKTKKFRIIIRLQEVKELLILIDEFKKQNEFTYSVEEVRAAHLIEAFELEIK